VYLVLVLAWLAYGAAAMVAAFEGRNKPPTMVKASVTRSWPLPNVVSLV
jgi:hypothetical protein